MSRDIDQIIEDAIDRAMERQRQEATVCKLGIDKEQHDTEHDFLRKLIDLADRLDRIKWGFLGSLVRSIGMLMVAALVIGLIVMAKSKGVDLP